MLITLNIVAINLEKIITEADAEAYSDATTNEIGRAVLQQKVTVDA